MLPQAEATLKSAEAGYETGKIDFNTLIEAQRQILRTRLALLDAEVETFLRLAELEQLTGVAL
jgi:outer membrane protein TolC